MVLVGILNDTGKGGTGVVVPGWQLLVRGQLSPFLFVSGIFFCLVPARWHFLTDFSICLSDGKGIGWGDFDSAWGFALQNVPTSYSLRKVKNKIEDFRVSSVIKMRWNLFLCSSGSDVFWGSSSGGSGFHCSRTVSLPQMSSQLL